MPAIYWSAPDSGTWLALYGVVESTVPKNIFDKAVGTGPFTDEFCFTLFRPDGQRHINRSLGGESFTNTCIVETDRFFGDSAVVWGGISHCVKSHLVVIVSNLTAVRYRDEVLHPAAVPLVQQLQLILQHDNIRSQVARVCSSFLANHNNTSLNWPSYSPGLFPN